MNTLFKNFIILFFCLIAVSCASKNTTNTNESEEKISPFDRFGHFGRN